MRKSAIVCLALVGLGTSCAWADTALDARVAKAIKTEIEYLWSLQKEDGGWGVLGTPTGHYAFSYNPQGPTALVAYALMEAGESVQDPRMVKALALLEKEKTDRTYTLAMRCHVWRLAVKGSTGLDKARYLNLLQSDVHQMYEKVNSNGSYGYACGGGVELIRKIKGKPVISYDNSNSQYGVLGVWAGVRANPPIQVPAQYWQVVMKHWLSDQKPDGGWDYLGANYPQSLSTATMTVAGIATLFVCLDNLYSESFVNVGDSSREVPAIRRGLDWIENRFRKPSKDPKSAENAHLWYYLYGIERVGLASGYRYFGSVDWYKWGLDKCLPSAGRGRHIDSAFRLLFMIRGQNPVLFNKLEYAGDWNNRPRAMASLTDWLNLTFEINCTWQIVTSKAPLRLWHDAPIMVITGNKAPNFTSEEIEKLRLFVQQGGTILSCREGSGEAFSNGMRKFYKDLFPDYPLTKCDPADELYSICYKVPVAVALSKVSNGVRTLAIHADGDLPASWQTRISSSEKAAYDIAANVYMYVTDKGTGLRHRDASHWPDDIKAPQGGTKVAILKWNGNFNPEPQAFERFKLMMKRDYSLAVDPSIVEIDKLHNGYKVAVLAGTGELKLSDEEMKALKRFVSGGGTLLVSAVGGSKEFDESAKPLVTKMFGELKRLPATATLFTMSGIDGRMKIDKVKYRRKTFASKDQPKDPLLQATDGNRPTVLYSREDIVAGLLGTYCFGIDGYDPETAFALMRNIVNRAGGIVTRENEADTPDPNPKPPAKKTKPQPRRPS